MRSTADEYDQRAAKEAQAPSIARACKLQVQELGIQGLLSLSKNLDDRDPAEMQKWTKIQNAAYVMRMDYGSGMWKGEQAELAEANQMCESIQQPAQTEAEDARRFAAEAAALHQIANRLQ